MIWNNPPVYKKPPPLPYCVSNIFPEMKWKRKKQASKQTTTVFEEYH